jgi:hypothetical protein
LKYTPYFFQHTHFLLYLKIHLHFLFLLIHDQSLLSKNSSSGFEIGRSIETDIFQEHFQTSFLWTCSYARKRHLTLLLLIDRSIYTGISISYRYVGTLIKYCWQEAKKNFCANFLQAHHAENIQIIYIYIYIYMVPFFIWFLFLSLYIWL